MQIRSQVLACIKDYLHIKMLKFLYYHYQNLKLTLQFKINCALLIRTTGFFLFPSYAP